MYYTLKDLREAGLTVAEIADILGYTKDAVHKAINETHREFRFEIDKQDKGKSIITWKIVNFGETKFINEFLYKKIKTYKK